MRRTPATSLVCLWLLCLLRAGETAPADVPAPELPKSHDVDVETLNTEHPDNVTMLSRLEEQISKSAGLKDVLGNLGGEQVDSGVISRVLFGHIFKAIQQKLRLRAMKARAHDKETGGGIGKKSPNTSTTEVLQTTIAPEEPEQTIGNKSPDTSTTEVLQTTTAPETPEQTPHGRSQVTEPPAAERTPRQINRFSSSVVSDSQIRPTVTTPLPQKTNTPTEEWTPQSAAFGGSASATTSKDDNLMAAFLPSNLNGLAPNMGETNVPNAASNALIEAMLKEIEKANRPSDTGNEIPTESQDSEPGDQFETEMTDALTGFENTFQDEVNDSTILDPAYSFVTEAEQPTLRSESQADAQGVPQSEANVETITEEDGIPVTVRAEDLTPEANDQAEETVTPLAETVTKASVSIQSEDGTTASADDTFSSSLQEATEYSEDHSLSGKEVSAVHAQYSTDPTGDVANIETSTFPEYNEEQFEGSAGDTESSKGQIGSALFPQQGEQAVELTEAPLDYPVTYDQGWEDPWAPKDDEKVKVTIATDIAGGSGADYLPDYEDVDSTEFGVQSTKEKGRQRYSFEELEGSGVEPASTKSFDIPAPAVAGTADNGRPLGGADDKSKLTSTPPPLGSVSENLDESTSRSAAVFGFSPAPPEPVNVDSTLNGIKALQEPLRITVINKLGVKFENLAHLFQQFDLNNPFSDISDIVSNALSNVRLEDLRSLKKRDASDDLHTLHFLVNGVRVAVGVPADPDFTQEGPTEIRNLSIDQRRMYVTLQLCFVNVNVPFNFRVVADLFPPFFSIRKTNGSAVVNIGEILVPMRIPYKLYFQKSDGNGDGKATGVLMPEDFVTHGASMLNVHTRTLGCHERDFMENEVIRFEEKMKNNLELWVSKGPLTLLTDNLRGRLLSSSRQPTTMSLSHEPGKKVTKAM